MSVTIIIVVTIVIVVASILINDTKSEWFTSLIKPAFNPPNWVFGAAWSVLYLALIVGAVSAYKAKPDDHIVQIYFMILVLTLGWILSFTVYKNMWLGFLVLLATIVLTVYLINLVADISTTAFFCFGAFALWIFVATYLNAGFLYLNRND